VCTGLPKESQFQLVTLIKQMIEEVAFVPVGLRDLHINQVGTLRLFEQAEGVKSLVTVFQNSIMHGSTAIRIDAAICFKYLIELAKPEAMKKELIKICGALIRVVNDKFPPELKLEIFRALRLMMLKNSPSMRAMVAQLQTTFLKAFNDPAADLEVRNTVVSNLLLLVKLVPKCDPIVKELTTSLDQERVERESKTQVSEVLAYICKERGDKIAPKIAEGVLSTLKDMIDDNIFSETLNHRTKANIAAAYAFLGAHHSPKEEWAALFDQYDEDSVITATGVKVAMLLSGKLDHKAEQVHAHLRQLLDVDLFSVFSESGPSGESEHSAINNLKDNLSIVTHFGNTIVRKFADETFYENYCNIVAGAFSQLAANQSKQEQFVYAQINDCIATLPIIERFNTQG